MNVTSGTGEARESAKVFLSYSRKDRERAQSIADVLRERHFGVFKDTDDILPTEEWKGRLEQLIAEADTIVFLLSPHSLASEVCEWEVEYARSLNKRIAPIVISEVESGDIPAELARLNFIFCTERDRFQDAVDNLVSALSTDIEWIREHTRLGELARRWDQGGRPSRLSLRGQDISDAESWRDEHPVEAPLVTPLQSAFIASSRRAASRRQQIAAISSVCGLVVALGLAAFAYVQRETAVENAMLAAENAQRAAQAQGQAERERDAAQVNQSLLLTGFAEQELGRALPVEAALLALEAIPDHRSVDSLSRDRPLVDEAQVMLRKAMGQMAEETVLLSGLMDSRFSVSPDGRWLALHEPRGRAVHVLDLHRKTPARKVVLSAAVGVPHVPAFSPDSTRVAVPVGAGGVLVLSTIDPDETRELDLGGAQINQVAFLDGGTELLVVDQQNAAVAIDLDTGETTFREAASVLAVTPDGARFALYRDNRILVFDANTKARIGQTQKPLSQSGAVVKRMTYNRDGSFLAAATEHRTIVVNGETAAFYARTGQKDQSLMDFGFDPTGAWHFVSGVDGRTQIYDLQSLSKVVEHSAQRGWIFDVAISSGQQGVLTASTDGNVQLWSPRDDRILAHLRGHTDMVVQTAFVDGDRGALTLSEDGTLRRWSVADWMQGALDADRETRIEGYAGSPVFTRDRRLMALTEAGVFQVESGDEILLEQRPGFTSVFRRFSENGRWLLAELQSQQTGESSNACLYDTRTGKIARCIHDDDDAGIFDVDMDEAAQIILYKQIVGDAYDRHFVVIDAHTGAELGRKIETYRTQLERPIAAPGGDRVFILDANHKVEVFDRSMTRLTAFGPDRDGVKVRFSDNRHLVAFIWPADGEMEIWDTQTQTLLSRVKTPYPDNDATVFSPAGTYVAASLGSSELAVYRIRDGEMVARLQIKAEGWIGDPVFSADEALLAAHMDDRIAVLDVMDGRTITELKMDFRGYAPLTFGKRFSDEGDALTAWSWDGPTRFELMRDAQTVVEAAQQQVPRCLSAGQRKRFYLPPAPPRWCITGPGRETSAPEDWVAKYPYGAERWRDWQIAVDAGKTPTLPSE